MAGNLTYKKKYFKLIHSMGMVHSSMCERCPFMKSCCGGCKILKKHLNKIKNENREVKWENLKDT